ncbi:MAG: hypothetical protein J6N49_05260 [Alphaproteobacteria bacterium]|nr:hypothetical protein [Alphaproteobacteria bacterium]
MIIISKKVTKLPARDSKNPNNKTPPKNRLSKYIGKSKIVLRTKSGKKTAMAKIITNKKL